MRAFILTIISVMLLADAAWWVAAHRMLRDVPRRRLWRAGLAIFMTACMSGLLLIILSRASWSMRDALGAPVIAALFIWHFIALPVATLMAGGLGLVKLVRRWSAVKPVGEEKTSIQRPEATNTPVLSRRALFGAAFASTPPLFTAIGTFKAMDQLDEFRIRRLTIPLNGLPRDLDGLTIAHVSDVHVGSFTRGKTPQKIAEATNNLRADLVLQTGDLINRAIADLPGALDMARRFAGRYGHFIVQGNHDLMEDRREFDRQVVASGLPLLNNASADLLVRGVPVQILGLAWGFPRAFPGTAGSPGRAASDDAITASMRQLLLQRRVGSFPILLAHHPHAFDPAVDAGVPLVLAGHTHGGQLHLSPNIGFGPAMYRYWSGLYRRVDSALVVSNGVGNWFPLRINAPAEIVHITLRRA